MNYTKTLMIAASVMTGTLGLILIFIPEESIAYLDMDPSNLLIAQIAGALYFGFAMMNWMTKGNLMGGIYSRPIAIGNFTHFMIASFALIKMVVNNTGSMALIILCVLYVIFAVLFGYVLFTPPGKVG